MTSTQSTPTAFEAFEETAAYCEASLTRSQAITEAREADWRLTDDYLRRELRARRVYMRRIEGEEAESFFEGDHDSGWLECDKAVAGAIPMWKVEPCRP